MENRPTLNWRAWSTVRKAQLSGAIAGLLLSVAIILSFLATEPHDFFDFFSILWRLVSALPYAIMRAIGFGIIHSGRYDISWITFNLVVVINSLLSFIAGSAVGWLLKIQKSR